MMRHLFKSLWLITSLMLLIAHPASPAFACSGGSGEINTLEVVIEYPILAHGTVLEVDDAGFNAILQVEKYLIGQGPDQLLLYRNDPVLSVVHRERNYDTGCLYGGTATAWTAGINGIFALSRLPNGTYHAAADSYFALRQDEVHYYRDDPTSDQPYKAINEQLLLAEFEALVAEMSGQTATYPNSHQTNLRRRELLLTTVSGNQYLLPIDGYEAITLEASEPCVDDCITYSADGSHYAHQTDADHIQFFYAYGESYEKEGVNLPVEIEGQAVSFAPDGDFVLVWNNDQLILYRIVARSEDTNGNTMYKLTIGLVPLTTLPLQLTDEPIQAIWSEDSTTFIYTDADGVWYFDFYDTTKPWLLLPPEEETPGLALSKTGRYFSYGTVHYRILMDVQTGVSYLNGLISHDESRLIRFENQNLKLAMPGNCLVSLSTSCPIVIQLENVQLNEAFWTGHNELLLIYCRPDNLTRCNRRELTHVTPGQVIKLDDEYITDYHFPLIATAYEPHSESLAIVTGDVELQFNDSLRFTVTGLDSPIASIAWGKSLWYTARQ